MQSFCDLETDQMTAARFRSAASAPTPTPAPKRESWLDRLARKLAPIPVDHFPVVAPRHLSTAKEIVRTHRRPQCC